MSEQGSRLGVSGIKDLGIPPQYVYYLVRRGAVVPADREGKKGKTARLVFDSDTVKNIQTLWNDKQSGLSLLEASGPIREELIARQKVYLLGFGSSTERNGTFEERYSGDFSDYSLANDRRVVGYSRLYGRDPELLVWYSDQWFRDPWASAYSFRNSIRPFGGHVMADLDMIEITGRGNVITQRHLPSSTVSHTLIQFEHDEWLKKHRASIDLVFHPPVRTDGIYGHVVNSIGSRRWDALLSLETKGLDEIDEAVTEGKYLAQAKDGNTQYRLDIRSARTIVARVHNPSSVEATSQSMDEKDKKPRALVWLNTSSRCLTVDQASHLLGDAGKVKLHDVLGDEAATQLMQVHAEGAELSKVVDRMERSNWMCVTRVDQVLSRLSDVPVPESELGAIARLSVEHSLVEGFIKRIKQLPFKSEAMHIKGSEDANLLVGVTAELKGKDLMQAIDAVRGIVGLDDIRTYILMRSR